MEEKDHNPALSLGRRQKRLAYWKKQIALAEPGSDDAGRLGEMFSSYALLISKLTKKISEAELAETENRIADLEREFVSLFEARRLMTSDIGTAAIKD